MDSHQYDYNHLDNTQIRNDNFRSFDTRLFLTQLSNIKIQIIAMNMTAHQAHFNHILSWMCIKMGIYQNQRIILNEHRIDLSGSLATRREYYMALSAIVA